MTTIMEFCTPPIPGETHKYYGDAHNALIHLPHYSTQNLHPGVNKIKKRSAEQNTLHNLAAIGNLVLLKQILVLLPDPLKAANDPHSSTGLTPLHYAAARGHLKVVECLVDEYSAVIDAKDNEGETALHKAAYSGRYHIVKYLQSKKANIHQQDKDGWTALHNACARGCLPIVRLLINHGARVDVRSKLGHTPLINAASKGHISIVEYLLDEAHANPLLKNNIGEAAYDASAASREAYICELLEKAEKKWWDSQEAGSLSSTRNLHYDVLDYHVTVMVTLHENERATSILGLSRPQFNASYLNKQDTRGAWSLHPSGIPSSKDQVEPPRQSNDTSKTNWFWITDWQIDLSDPRIDPTSGWQYARSFEEEDEQWTPVAPTGGNGWVRRRRWVRVMNRQADFTRNLNNDDYESTLSNYLTVAEEMVTGGDSYDNQAGLDQRVRMLTNQLRAFEESVQFLLAGIKDDANQSRRERANNLVKVHSAKIDQLNAEIAFLAPQLTSPIPPNDELSRALGFVTSKDHQHGQMDDSDDDGYLNKTSFDANPWARGSSDTFQSPSVLGGDAPQHDESGTARAFVWESDYNVKDCRRCHRRFGLLNRRHHCRRCGLIVCDRCSASRAYLPASQVLQPPKGSTGLHVLETQQQRICDSCCTDLGINPA